MGYWNAGRDGSSLHSEETGLVWGDRPADIIDGALDQIYKTFVDDVGRAPTEAEIRAGIEFSLPAFFKMKKIEREEDS